MRAHRKWNYERKIYDVLAWEINWLACYIECSVVIVSNWHQLVPIWSLQTILFLNVPVKVFLFFSLFLFFIFCCYCSPAERNIHLIHFSTSHVFFTKQTLFFMMIAFSFLLLCLLSMLLFSVSSTIPYRIHTLLYQLFISFTRLALRKVV